MNLERDKLRNYQKKAVSMIEKYIRSSEKNKSALVQMPTGTGKSGVMAFSVNLFPKRSFLIIVPNAALPFQMKEEINEKFWEKIGGSIEKKRVAEIITNKTDFSKNGVYISTIQKLSEIKKNSNEQFLILKNRINVVFYDEGHHEPANEWSKVSRDFECKKVLFTATPYRNDLHSLNISEKYIVSYFLWEAIENKDIVSPEFHEIPDEIISDTEKLALFIKEHGNGYKSLVRIMGAETITKLGTAISDKLNSACCHSALPVSRDYHYYNNGEALLKEAENYDIIIQTDMVSEGVDLPYLNQLYYIDGYNNAKSMLQIFGRVLRNCEGKEKADIFVPASKLAEIKRQWDICTTVGKEQIYVNGHFVTKINIFGSEDIIRILNYEKQARVLIADHSVYDEIVQSIQERLDRVTTIIRDVKEGRTSLGGNKVYAICYEHQTPSRYLREGYYLNAAIDYISLVEISKGDATYYFYHSTQRLSIDFQGAQEIAPNDLYKLISNSSELLNVSFKSAMNSQIGIKDYHYKGIRLNSLASSREQRLGLFHNALASNGGKLRYISNSASKVTDRNEYADVEGYVEWCKNLAEVITSGVGYSYFNRFATVVKQPSGEQPDYILISNCYIESSNRSEERIYLYNLFEMSGNRFVLEKEGIKVDCVIENVRGKNLISLQNGEGEEYRTYNEEKESEYTLNSIKNNFMLYYCISNTIYYDGFYYKPNIGLYYSDPTHFELRNRIVAVDGMEKCINEKYGTHPGGDFGGVFPADSIFGVVQQYLMKNANEFDYILCEDLGYEIADLIAVNSTQQRICMIQCKYSVSSFGAGAFHEVCGQAIKNITEFIVTNCNQMPYLDSLLKKWETNTWTINKGQYTSKRFLKGDYASFCDVFKKIIGSATARKEAWIATSGLSLSKLDQELMSHSSKRKLLPLIHLLHSTEDVFSGIGVEFKVLCKK